ncbi:MAG: hypothetical protein QG622_2967 [Actinomycetota bacterium]|nr:hypothetical protein [Actinomycetota bacterium]
MNHTDANGAGEHRRRIEGLRTRFDRFGSPVPIPDRSTTPVLDRRAVRSTAINGLVHEQLARQRHREVPLGVRRIRGWRTARAVD